LFRKEMSCFFETKKTSNHSEIDGWNGRLW
jgi:hypothetical protein